MKKYLLVLCLIAAPVSSQNTAYAQTSNTPHLPRVYLDTTYAPPGGPVRFVPAGGNLQAAINAANPGDTITLQAGATFTGSFTLPVKSGSSYIYIRTSAPDESLPPPGTRIDPSYAPVMAKIESPDYVPVIATSGAAHHYRFVGIEFSVAPGVELSYSIIDLGATGAAQNSMSQVPQDIIIDRCYLHGNSTGTMIRGVALNSGRTAIIDSYISDIHAVNADTQALCGWNGPGPFKIVNNYLEAAGENVLFGGGDPSIGSLVPSDIEIRRNHFFKPLSWKVGHPSFAGRAWVVKNSFELKNARRVLIDGNVFENSWPHGQNGFAIVITPRNQDGSAPWSAVQDITITNNKILRVSCGLNILGSDDLQSSQQTQRVMVRNNIFDEVGGGEAGGAGILFQVLSGTHGLVIDHNTGFHTGAVILADGTANTGFVSTNNLTPHNQYGVIGGGTGSGTSTLNEYFPGDVYSANVMQGGRSEYYPAGNFFPATMSDVGFVDRAGGNYRLASSSPYNNAGTDGTDIGVNMDELEAATGPGTSTPTPTPNDTAAPTITDVGTGSVSTTSAEIRWATNEASDAQSEYGTTTAYSSATPVSSVLQTAHAQTLDGLQPDTLYHYRVKSRDASGNLATSGDFSLRTAAVTSPPGGPGGPGGTGGTGLVARYYNDPGTGSRFTSLVLTRTDAAIDFDWGQGTPGAGVQADNFSVRWAGQVLAPVTGTYRFSTTSDDGVRLWVNGQLVVDRWSDRSATTDTSGEIALIEGTRYDVEMEYYERGVDAVAKLLWSYPGEGRHVIPQDRFSGPAACTAGVFLPGSVTWFLRNTNSGGSADLAFSYGPADGVMVPIRGDWDGDGKDTPGLYDPATGMFFLNNRSESGPADLVFAFGPTNAGLVAISGDWNGDGIDSIGLYNPFDGALFLKHANTEGPADLTFAFGPAGAGLKALAGDWNGDGVDTIGLYNPSTRAFFLKNANSTGPGDVAFIYGPNGAVPVSGDWDGDRVDTIGAYIPSTRAWFLRNSNSSGSADRTFVYGPSGATPLGGDWDGL